MAEPIVVVGAGVIGLAAAVEIAEAGSAVVVVDRGSPGSGTSGTSFSWLNANRKLPRAYHDLNVAGVEAYRRLSTLRGTGIGINLDGRIEVADTPASIEGLARATELMRSFGYPVEELSVERATALEPSLRISPGAEIRLWSSEGYVVPERFVRHLVGRAVAAGVRFVLGQDVVAFERAGGRIAGVRLADGSRIHGRAVIVCAGRWSEQLAALAGVNLPMQRDERGGATLGLLLYTGPLDIALARTVSTPLLNVRPDEGGRLVLQATELDPAVTPDAVPSRDGAEAVELLGRAERTLHGFGDAFVESIRRAVRAIPVDRLSVAGWAPGVEGLYVVATHSGYTLALLLGELARREVLEGADEPMLAPFRPARFAAPGATV